MDILSKENQLGAQRDQSSGSSLNWLWPERRGLQISAQRRKEEREEEEEEEEEKKGRVCVFG